MLFIRVDNRVRVPAASIPPRVREELFTMFTHRNPEYERERKRGYASKEPPNYVTWTTEDGDLTFPLGGFKRVRHVLRSNKILFQWVDERTSDDGDPGIPDHKLTLHDYQGSCLEAAIARQVCLIRAPTGSGKTTIGIAGVARLKVPTCVMVWTGNLLDQWHERLIKELGVSKHDIGIIREGNVDIRPITLAMQQSVHALFEKDEGAKERIGSAFSLFIFDEVQRAAAATMFSAIDPFRARWRWGISADESRKDGKEFLTYDLFGGVAASIERQTLIDSGHILDVSIIVDETDFAAPWYRFDRDFNRLLEQMTTDDDRNEHLLRIIDEELARGDQVLVLSHRVEHCRWISSALVSRGIPNGLLLGGKANEADFRMAIPKLKSGEWRAAVGTVQAIGQGLDIPSMSSGIIATPLATNRQQFGQVRGRFCRTAEGKQGARLRYLWDRQVYGRNAIENLRSWNGHALIEMNGQLVDVREYMKSIKKKSA